MKFYLYQTFNFDLKLLWNRSFFCNEKIWDLKKSLVTWLRLRPPNFLAENFHLSRRYRKMVFFPLIDHNHAPHTEPMDSCHTVGHWTTAMFHTCIHATVKLSPYQFPMFWGLNYAIFKTLLLDGVDQLLVSLVFFCFHVYLFSDRERSDT